MNTKRLICSFLVCFTIFISLMFFISWWANLPIIYESWSTGICVKMEINGKILPCNKKILNEKFIHIWVK